MAKLKRSELKGLVKECLVELLAEGLNSSNDGRQSEILESRRRTKRKEVLLREEKRLAANRKKLETRVADTVSSVTDDPIMQSILSHTAQTTLQEQISNEVPGRVGMPNTSGLMSDGSSSSAGINLDSIFSGPQENWSSLAFAEKKTDQQ